MSHLTIQTEIGECILHWEGGSVSRFSLPGGPLERGDECASPPEWVQDIAARVALHLSGKTQDFADVPFDWDRVTPFQRDVYRVALGVKSGTMWTYGQVANALPGSPGPGGARAVGVALGQNPWPLLVPCHRFIGADGGMTGFSASGGIRTKLRLLAIEGSQLFAE